MDDIQIDSKAPSSGGGFMLSQATQSADPSLAPARSRDSQGPLPLTVKQIIEPCSSSKWKANVIVDGVVDNKVTVAGMACHKVLGKTQLIPSSVRMPKGADHAVAANPAVRVFPRPLAEYNDIVANDLLFSSTLMVFHSVMNTKFWMPQIGGDCMHPYKLYQLFVEVTSRGGAKKVRAREKWGEVAEVLNLPEDTVELAGRLRSIYSLLLKHYENVYFFRATGYIPKSSGTYTLVGKGKAVTMEPSQFGLSS